MAEKLAGAYTFTLTDSVGNTVTTDTNKLASESHGHDFRFAGSVPANSIDFPIALPDFATISYLSITVNAPVTYKLGVNTNNPLTCRKFAIHTPNAEAIPAIFVTAGAVPVVAEIVAVGD